MQLIRILTILFLLIPSVSFAAPKLLFSDVTDGVNNGWHSDSTKGIPVSIWCYDIPDTRGTSYVTVGGVDLTSDTDYVEWAATTNPQTVRYQKRITFYLNNSMAADGAAPNTTITVTTSEGTSNSIPFHVRSTGNIYYLSTSGDDTSGDGSYASPWKTGAALRNAAAGDAFFLRGGVYLDVDPLIDATRATWNQIYESNMANGTAYNSILVSSYPGELAQIGDGSCYDATSGNIVPDVMIDRPTSTTTNSWEYWTYSKIKTVTATGVISEGNSGANYSDSNIRFVGMDVRTTRAMSGTGIPFTKEGGGGGSAYFYILGCYIHHTGVPLAPTTAPTLATGSGTGLTGTYSAKYTWCELTGTAPAYETLQESEMSDAGASVTLSNGSLSISWPSPPADHYPAYTHVRIYRTKADDLSTYYLVGEFPIGDGSYDSSEADSSLGRSYIDAGYRVGPIYIGGYGSLNYIYIGFNEFYKTNGNFQNYGHVSTDTIDNIHIYNNIFDSIAHSESNKRPSLVTGGGDGASGYRYVQTEYVYNNIFINGWGPAIRVDGYTTGGGGDYYIYNNTIYLTGAETYLEMGGNTSKGGTVYFKNNIIYLSGPTIYNTCWYGEGRVCGNMDGSNNVYYGVGPEEVPPWDTSTLTNNDPLFVSTTDLHLQSTSPAIDAGITHTITDVDFDQVPRPQGAAYDVGAFEFLGGAPLQKTYRNVGSVPLFH